MIVLANRRRLLLEAAQPGRVGAQPLGQDLDGDVPPEPVVAGAKDLAHSSRPDGRDEEVRAEARANLYRHGSTIPRGPGKTRGHIRNSPCQSPGWYGSCVWCPRIS